MSSAAIVVLVVVAAISIRVVVRIACDAVGPASSVVVIPIVVVATAIRWHGDAQSP